MGRPSKLTDHQRAEIGRRLALGETTVALAKEFKVSQPLISGLFSDRVETIKNTAHAIADAEMRLERLPVSDRLAVRTLSDQLKEASGHLANAACNGAKTASILSGLAARKAEAMTCYDELEVRGIAALAATGTEASKIATTLINSKHSAPMAPDEANTFSPEQLMRMGDEVRRGKRG